VIALDVDGVPPGAYHYDVEHHALEALTAGDHREAVRTGLLRRAQPAFTPRAAVITGTRFERTMWRYREAFSYRSVHHDLGHLSESLRLLARALRRNFVRGLDVEEAVIEPLLGLDGIEEAAMSFAIIG
jgi:SagB-type dehydrogenase family enzyme